MSKKADYLFEKKKRMIYKRLNELEIDFNFYSGPMEEDCFYEAISKDFNLNCFGKTKEKAHESLKSLIFGTILSHIMENKKISS